MWSREHDRRLKTPVNALADDVARALSIDRLGADTFPAFASAARSSLARALSEFASSINEQSSINRLPPELLCCIARFLPFPTVVSSSAVCRKWRSALENDISLWRCLEVYLNDTPAHWATTLHPLLTRSCRFPLHLSLRFGCGAHLQALQECMKLVVSHMDHIVELSIGVPLAVAAHDCLWALVDAPAPVLEIFRVLCQDDSRNSGFIQYIPPTLFSGHAPRLHTLYGRRATLPPLFGPAFSSLKHITYDNSPIFMDVSKLLMTLQSCPALDTLVLLMGCAPDITPTVLPSIPSVATLFIYDNDTLGTDALLAHFPAAMPATILSFAHQIVAPERMLSHLQAAAPISDLDLSVRPLGLAQTFPSREVHYAVRINGTLTYVDLTGLLVQDLFSQNHTLTFSVHTVERLALPLALADALPLFWARLTGLRELVLYGDPEWGSAWPAVLPSAAIPLETLRFVVRADQVWSSGARVGWTSQIGPIVKTLATAIGGRIRKLILPGFPALTKADLANMVDEIVLDSPASAPTDPGFESWFWDFDTDAAVHA